MKSAANSQQELAETHEALGQFDLVLPELNNTAEHLGRLIGAEKVTVSKADAEKAVVLIRAATEHILSLSHHKDEKDLAVEREYDLKTRGAIDSKTAAGKASIVPVVTHMAPKSGVPGTDVTIRGFNFRVGRGLSDVTFGGVSAKTRNWGPTQISAEVPRDAKSGDVKVIVEGRASNAMPFELSSEAKAEREREASVARGAATPGKRAASVPAKRAGRKAASANE